jgi:flagellar FliL protein
MSATTTATTEQTPAEAEAAAAPNPSRKRKLILLAAPLTFAAFFAGLWFSGVLPRMIGIAHKKPDAEAKAAAAPIYVDLPEMVANLNSDARRPEYVKLLARVEVSRPEDADRVKQAIPRLQDMFQTYLREMRPEELRGSAGTYRLREELIIRANIAAAPAHVTDVLFIQMLVQ